MVRRTSTGKGPQYSSLTDLRTVDPGISLTSRTQMEDAYKAAAAQLDNSFASHHPILNTVGNAALGAALYGPAGLALMPMISNKREAGRKSNVIEAYQNTMKSITENEKNLVPARESGNRGHSMHNTLRNNGYQSPLEDYAQIDAETEKNLLNGITGQDTYQQLLNDQQNTMKTTWNKMATVAGGMINPPKKPKPGQTTPPVAGPQLDPGLDTSGQQFTTGAQQAQEVPLRLAQYADPDMLKTGITANAGIINNTFQNVPAYMKLPSDIKAKLAEAALHNAQTTTEGYRPKLIQAQTDQARSTAELHDRTNPNLLGSFMEFNAMTPEQKQLYLNHKAGITPPKPPTLTDSYQQAGLEQMAQEKGWDGRPTPKALMAQQALTRFRGSQPNHPAAAPPMGGTVVKGQHGAYSF